MREYSYLWSSVDPTLPSPMRRLRSSNGAAHNSGGGDGTVTLRRLRVGLHKINAYFTERDWKVHTEMT